MLLSRFHHPHQHADAAHLGRRSTDWGKVVDSMVLSTESLCNSAITQIKQIVNTELTGVNGPTKEFRGECPVQVGQTHMALRQPLTEAPCMSQVSWARLEELARPSAF